MKDEFGKSVNREERNHMKTINIMHMEARQWKTTYVKEEWPKNRMNWSKRIGREILFKVITRK